jgi:hypothetical protein
VPSHVMNYEYVVTGRSRFPKEALALDMAKAATPEDQEKIDRLSAVSKDFVSDSIESINLIIPCAGRMIRPSVKMWGLYGWNVPGEFEYHAERSRNGHREHPFVDAPSIADTGIEPTLPGLLKHVVRSIFLPLRF